MTDTVNVPRFQMKDWRNDLSHHGVGDIAAAVEMDILLAAAPKAEPEWRETSLTTDPLHPKIWVCAMENGVGGRVCVSGPSPADAQVSARAAAADYDRRIAQPEAPKGEPVDEEIGEEYDIAAHCVTLAECPAGLFFWNGSLGFKSEYGAMEPDETSNGKLWRVSNRPDAYCADSGEYFWGGAKTHDERANMLVYPISAETVAMVASHGQDALAHPATSSELLEAKAMVLDHLMSAEID